MADEDEKPTWLVVMENGSIGEARTRAFLTDRFWILERSVDIDGADFFIQRRVTARNLLDEEPPRLGVVQVKFFQDGRTTQYVHKEYVHDERERPRAEFFVLAHTGKEDDKQMFLIPAESVSKDFEIVGPGKKHEGKYRLPGTEVLIDKYRVIRPSQSLERIEHALRNADLRGNRRFVSWVLPDTRENPGIKREFAEPLPNYWSDLPRQFRELKEKAHTALIEVEDFYDIVRRIVTTNDPLVALEAAEALKKEGYLVRIGDLYDEDFHTVAKEHGRRVGLLREAGLLDRYLDLQTRFVRELIAYLTPQMPLSPPETVCVAEVIYHTGTFALGQVTFKLAGPDDPPIANAKGAVVEAAPGRVVLQYAPRTAGYKVFDGRELKSIDDRPWPDKLVSEVGEVVRPLLELVFQFRFGKPEHPLEWLPE